MYQINKIENLYSSSNAPSVSQSDFKVNIRYYPKVVKYQKHTFVICSLPSHCKSTDNPKSGMESLT